MKSLATALVCLLLLPACRKETATAPTAAQKAKDAEPVENDNRLALVFGGAAMDRSDEHSYENSVAHAIDATRFTAWTSAPGGKQMGIFTFPAPTRLRRLGATVIDDPGRSPKGLRFEASLDGTSWRPILEAKLAFKNRDPQYFDVTPPVDTRFLRVTAIEPAYQAHILSLHAVGDETGPVVQPDIEGCWLINTNMQARFVRAGARVIGTLGPMIVDGGTDGRVYRLMWLEGAMWGYAAVTVAADGNHLSGVRWHEEVNPKNSGDGWLGHRVPCTGTAAINTAKIVDDIIRRSAVWRLYGMRLDAQDRIIAAESEHALNLAAKIVREHPQHRFRIVAREFRESNEEKNRARCAAKLSAIREALRARSTDLARIEFVVAGSERHPLAVDFTSMNVMDSGVELQVAPSR